MRAVHLDFYVSVTFFAVLARRLRRVVAGFAVSAAATVSGSAGGAADACRRLRFGVALCGVGECVSIAANS